VFYCLKPGRISELRGALDNGEIARLLDRELGVYRTSRATVWHWDKHGIRLLKSDGLPRMVALAKALGKPIFFLLDEREPSGVERRLLIKEARHAS
jgi:hypothetical protein